MWTRRKSWRAIRTLVKYGRRHRSWLGIGTAASIGVVLFRLALPWPLRGVVEVVFPKGTQGGKLLVDYLPAWGDPILWLGAFYLILAFGAGLFELFQRTNIMRFAAHTVHDLRADAVRSVNRQPIGDRRTTGDLIARIIGDSARIKAGVAGILVHVLQNGLIFLGVCGILLYISPPLGLISLGAGLAALIIGVIASRPVAETAGRQRRKESDYADAIQGGFEGAPTNLDLDRINLSSAKKEVSTTKLIALSSLAVHVVLAGAVAMALWVGTRQVRAGTLEPGELFLFIAYALTVHRRMVQVGRQLARSGKVFACTNRLGVLVADNGPGGDSIPAAPVNVPLVSALSLQGVRLSSGVGPGRKARLRATDLTIYPGTQMAVVGHVGAGKSSLLRLLAGIETPDKGAILWDGKDLSGDDGWLPGRVNYLPQDPVFAAAPIYRILGLPDPAALQPEQQETLRRIGAWTVIRNFPQGLEETVSSYRLTTTECRLLRLAGILLAGEASVWILDSPLDGRGRRQARRELQEIFQLVAGRTLVVALSQSIDLDRFQRVVSLRRGRIRFDGTPGEWKRFTSEPDAAVSGSRRS